MQTLTGLKNGKNEKTFRDRGSGLVVIFDSECVNGAVRLFSERCVNQKSVAGIGCGGRI
jgi:hypothetical protein